MRELRETSRRRLRREAASESTADGWSGGHFDGTAPFRLSSCSRDCPDCHGAGAIGLHPCTHLTQWLRRVGWSSWADVLSDRRAA